MPDRHALQDLFSFLPFLLRLLSSCGMVRGVASKPGKRKAQWRRKGWRAGECLQRWDGIVAVRDWCNTERLVKQLREGVSWMCCAQKR